MLSRLRDGWGIASTGWTGIHGAHKGLVDILVKEGYKITQNTASQTTASRYISAEKGRVSVDIRVSAHSSCPIFVGHLEMLKSTIKIKHDAMDFDVIDADGYASAKAAIVNFVETEAKVLTEAEMEAIREKYSF